MKNLKNAREMIQLLKEKQKMMVDLVFDLKLFTLSFSLNQAVLQNVQARKDTLEIDCMEELGDLHNLGAINGKQLSALVSLVKSFQGSLESTDLLETAYPA